MRHVRVVVSGLLGLTALAVLVPWSVFGQAVTGSGPVTFLVAHNASIGTIVAGTTIYLGAFESATSGGSEAQRQNVAPFAFTARKLYVSTTAAPGAGDSYTITLRHNGADAALTCAISGASATSCNDTAHTESIAATDTWDVKLVTSGALVNTFTGTITVSGTIP